MNKIFVYTFYRFLKINNKDKVKKIFEKFLLNKPIKGTILLADEGINCSISSDKENLDKLIIFVKRVINIRKLKIKINRAEKIPFNRMKVRLKKEIVTLGKGILNVKKMHGVNIHPKEWDKYIKNKDTFVIDVRNKFEIKIGKFKNAINPNTESFRDFPNFISEMKIDKNAKIAMYCTGGIRCEKASSYLKTKGYKNVSQLEGGIIEYLNYNLNNKKKSLWKGECFVFDDRVAINSNLRKGNYIQCFGCRTPITKKDTLSVNYVKGVSCPYCFDKRSEHQKNRSRVRQSQIEEAKRNNRYNVFLKNVIL